MNIFYKNKLGPVKFEDYKTPCQMSAGFLAGSVAATTTNGFEALTVKK